MQLPVALWANQWVNGRDCGGQSTGSTTMVNGQPVIVYPGGCRNGITTGPHAGIGSAYSIAVPEDPSDPLAKNWTRLKPIINNTSNDPSEAWQTPHGEWRLVGHSGGGPCTPGGPLNGSDCAGMWATADPGMKSGWYSVGTSPFLNGECQSFFPLPELYPGTTAAAGSMPTHVHHQGSSYMLGTYVDGTPGVGNAGSWAPTAGEPPFRLFPIDTGAYYASKGFTDHRNASSSKTSGRRILYGWNRSPPASQSLPRVVTYHPEIQRLVFAPAPELSLLRQTQLPTLANNTALVPNVSVPIAGNGSGWPAGAANAVEVRVHWKRPAGAANLSLGGATVHYTPPPAGAADAGAPYNVSVTGGCDGGRQSSLLQGCDGLWLLPSDASIELAVFVDHTVTESFWMDGRVAWTSGAKYDPEADGLGLQLHAVSSGESVVVESVQAWEMGSAWINETQALRMLAERAR